MSSLNTNVYNLEGGVDFGSDKLNEFYKKLDKRIQGKIKEINRESAIELLEIMSDPNIQEVYDGLTDTEKTSLKKMSIVNKYTTFQQKTCCST